MRPEVAVAAASQAARERPLRSAVSIVARVSRHVFVVLSSAPRRRSAASTPPIAVRTASCAPGRPASPQTAPARAAPMASSSLPAGSTYATPTRSLALKAICAL
jgi:hypothetical protein